LTTFPPSSGGGPAQSDFPFYIYIWVSGSKATSSPPSRAYKFQGESFASALSDLCATVLKGGTSVRGAFAYIINKYIYLCIHTHGGNEDAVGGCARVRFRSLGKRKIYKSERHLLWADYYILLLSRRCICNRVFTPACACTDGFNFTFSSQILREKRWLSRAVRFTIGGRENTTTFSRFRVNWLLPCSVVYNTDKHLQPPLPLYSPRSSLGTRSLEIAFN